MDFNTILFRFGLNSSNFVNKTINQIEIKKDVFVYEFEGDFIYEV